jgi:hypothetical protein
MCAFAASPSRYLSNWEWSLNQESWCVSLIAGLTHHSNGRTLIKPRRAPEFRR